MESLALHTDAPSPPATGPRVGAPRNNTNRVTHGLHGSALPRDARRIGRRLAEFRRSLCAAVEAAAGEIGLTNAATIDSACQWQRHLLLAARWLRLQHDALEPTERLAFSREVAKAAESRDRSIRLLALDADQSDDFDRLLRAGAFDPPQGDSANNAADAKPGAQEGNQ